MKVHHLNCGSFCPFAAGALIGNSEGMVCHTLLVETPRDGLVLVDSGFGRADVRDPVRRLGPGPSLLGARFREEDTASAQIAKLGYKATDVRHVILTHLDWDHAGGISDFPDARIHVLEREFAAATRPRTELRGLERERYRDVQWAHGPRWCISPHERGENWRGLRAVRELDGLPSEILLIPTEGHTRGHTAVAVQEEGGHWWLHCGDAYFHPGDVGKAPSSPWGLRAFQRIIAADLESMRANQRRLTELAREAGGDVTLVSAHDHGEFQGSLAAPAKKTSSRHGE